MRDFLEKSQEEVLQELLVDPLEKFLGEDFLENPIRNSWRQSWRNLFGFSLKMPDGIPRKHECMFGLLQRFLQGFIYISYL